MKGKIPCFNHGCKNQFKGFCTVNLKCGLCIDYSDKHRTEDFTEAEIDEMKAKSLRSKVNVDIRC